MAFRFLRILIFTRPLPEVPREEDLPFRVMPWDCDLNLHVNNARYLKFMDLGRFHLIHRGGLFFEVLRRGMTPVVSRVEIRYRKPLPPFQKFLLKTTLERTDHRAYFFRQVFHWKGKVFAEATVVGHVLKHGRPVDPSAIKKRG